MFIHLQALQLCREVMWCSTAPSLSQKHQPFLYQVQLVLCTLTGSMGFCYSLLLLILPKSQISLCPLPQVLSLFSFFLWRIFRIFCSIQTKSVLHNWIHFIWKQPGIYSGCPWECLSWWISYLSWYDGIQLNWSSSTVQTTCCQTGSIWGCCTLPNANCCGNQGGCCPQVIIELSWFSTVLQGWQCAGNVCVQGENVLHMTQFGSMSDMGLSKLPNTTNTSRLPLPLDH